MYWMLGILSLSLFALIASGIYLEMRPPIAAKATVRHWKGVVSFNLLAFVGAQIGLLFFGIQDVMAEQAATAAASGATEVSVGLGLALIGIGIPTALATIGAGIAVGPVGAASLAVISEKPEMFGRTLIYLGLAEGIAIYGLVVTILLLGKIG
jgi:V/A-type H+-transporting ATPase subunit K